MPQEDQKKMRPEIVLLTIVSIQFTNTSSITPLKILIAYQQVGVSQKWASTHRVQVACKPNIGVS